MKRLPQTEFICLVAMLAATVALSIDAMLPALPQIAAELTPDMPNRAQLIITSFVFGMGIGTFFTGPLSDAIGRKPVAVGGTAIYLACCVWAYFASSLEAVLLSRVFMGLGASGPRIVAVAIIRDLYSGRNMARITSFVMIVFSLVPAIAPTMGAAIIAISDWRGVFLAFMVFSTITLVWLLVRQPETLTPDKRRPIKVALLVAATKEMFANPTVRLSIFVQSLGLGMLFSVISSTQQIFDEVFGYGETFHFWFGGIAIVASSAGFLNARLVVRLGMRALIKAMLSVQIATSTGMILIYLVGAPENILFAAYVFWTTTVFFQAGMTIGNLNALGMEPMGHIAGMAASIMSSVSTISAVAIAAPIAFAYNGTPLPVAIGILLCAIAARFLTGKIERDSD